ncbi:pilus assembly PilX N-terminal domain-containing protein [Halomonas sp. H10-9-1]|uniref:pilus assembly PilX family protein n=1 Tax=Halomonas sp. H10-9-1 TaxID=2950871 RepID=UPI0032DE5DA7
MNKKTRQKGAALIVVLSLLSISLMVGLSSMQSSQIDERLAGNYKAATEAQMAAEYGAASGVAELEGGSNPFGSSGEACDTVADPGITEGDRLGWGWVDVDVPDEGLGYGLEAKVVECDDDVRGSLYISWGRVVNSSDILVAERFIIFNSSGGGGSWPPDLSEFFVDNDGGPIIGEDDLAALNENALLVGGALERNGNSEVLGPAPQSNLPDWSNAVPDPQAIIGWVKERADQGDSRIVISCDASFSKGGASIVFCDGDFVGDLDDRLSGMFVVASGNIGNWTPGNERINVQGDVDAYLISGGSMNFKGFGSNTVTGGVWAGGSLGVNGSSNFCGSVVVRGAARFNGASNFDIEGDGCVPGGGSGPSVWIPL